MTLTERAAEVVTVERTPDGDYDIKIAGVWIDNFSEADGANAKAVAIRAVFVREMQTAKQQGLLKASDFTMATIDTFKGHVAALPPEQQVRYAASIDILIKQVETLARNLMNLSEMAQS